MKLTFAIAIIAALASCVVAINIKNTTICKKFKAAENVLRKLKSTGISFRRIPSDKLREIFNSIETGIAKGCNNQAIISTPIKCKRYTQRGQSVICQ